MRNRNRNKEIIKVTENGCSLMGTESEILAGISMMINHLKEEISEEKIKFAVDLGLCGQKERAILVVNSLKEKLNTVFKEMGLDDDERKELNEILEELRKKGK